MFRPEEISHQVGTCSLLRPLTVSGRRAKIPEAGSRERLRRSRRGAVCRPVLGANRVSAVDYDRLTHLEGWALLYSLRAEAVPESERSRGGAAPDFPGQLFFRGRGN